MVSLPDRRYELAAQLFAEAIEETGEETPPPPLRVAAREHGIALGM
jgi:hypothetical protein